MQLSDRVRCEGRTWEGGEPGAGGGSAASASKNASAAAAAAGFGESTNLEQSANPSQDNNNSGEFDGFFQSIIDFLFG